MRRTPVQWVYKVDLESSRGCTTVQHNIVAWSIDEVLAILDKSKYRNWNVEKLERVVSISPPSFYVGKPRVVHYED